MNTKATTCSRWLTALALLFLLFGYSSPSFAADPVGTIQTVAGNGTPGVAGDGGPATAAQLGTPFGIAVDAAGNIYIADADNHCIRKVAINGIIATVAGSCIAGYSGDGGPATSARFYAPNDVAIDANGNLYISDTLNHVIRKVALNGIITTFAGSGVAGDLGDGGLATAARLNYPHGIAVDAVGNLYIADLNNNRIRKVDSAGIITTVAGTGNAGFSGDGGPATSAQLRHAVDVNVDVAGNLYIADAENHRIRKVNTSGIITTIAGNGNSGYSGDGGLAVNAQLNLPHGVAVDIHNNVYVSDRLNHRVRKIDASGLIITMAGTGAAGYSGDGGLATQAQLNQPFHLAIDSSGKLYFSQWPEHRVRRVILWTFCSNATGIPLAECEALVHIFEQTNGANWTNKTNWLQTTTPCSWFGVTCANGRVTRLDLPHNQLSGSLPTTVDALAAIQYFDVSRNAIGGAIPPQLGNLPKLLYLHLAYNQFTGPIPTTLGNLRTVVFFYLHNNLLTGSIPPELGGLVMVKTLTFTNNQLSGSLPATLGSLPQLQRLHLTNNQLTGTIPPELGNAVKLQELYLNVNQFSGPLPASLINLTQMTGLRFQTTSLCEPADAGFQSWKATITDVQSTGVICNPA